MASLLGGAAALGLTRLLGYLLYKVNPRNPLKFEVGTGGDDDASLAACLLPAWRGMRTDPVQALRNRFDPTRPGVNRSREPALIR